MKQHKSIKLNTDLIERIEAQAKKENRSFNNMVETILESFSNSIIIQNYPDGTKVMYKPDLGTGDIITIRPDNV